jgi:DNA repair exonuclease SbcCD ATPase subunit
MTYMKMVPIVAELKAHWAWHDAAARTPAERAAAQKKIAEMAAMLPPKETLLFADTVEMAAEDYAQQKPLIQRIKKLEEEETAELEKMEELKRLAAVKWGPKKLPSGETQTSVQKKLDALKAELDGLTEKVKALDERMAPLIESLKELDATYKAQADVDAWAARGYTGEVPACIVARRLRDADEFLAEAEVLRLPGRGRRRREC